MTGDPVVTPMPLCAQRRLLPGVIMPVARAAGPGAGAVSPSTPFTSTGVPDGRGEG
ncbi:hypothetical protein [Streptomyces sp. NPDC058861]|uniref:hypothetical protein n=1 Tax=Streptomyces sp. NPDC058861 TaxID=3346653 RepID=UPI0036738806